MLWPTSFEKAINTNSWANRNITLTRKVGQCDGSGNRIWMISQKSATSLLPCHFLAKQASRKTETWVSCTMMANHNSPIIEFWWGIIDTTICYNHCFHSCCFYCGNIFPKKVKICRLICCSYLSIWKPLEVKRNVSKPSRAVLISSTADKDALRVAGKEILESRDRRPIDIGGNIIGYPGASLCAGPLRLFQEYIVSLSRQRHLGCDACDAHRTNRSFSLIDRHQAVKHRSLCTTTV